MSDTGYLIWFVVTAVSVVILLAVGVSLAAGIASRGERKSTQKNQPTDSLDRR